MIEYRSGAGSGWDGRNDLINQRITGEIHFDEFDISHTKDDIQWLGIQEDEVQEKLKEICQDYANRARDYRAKDPTTRGPSATEVQTAVDTLETEMQSPEFVDRIELDTVPPPEIIDEIEKPIVEAAQREEPDFNATI